MKKLKLKDRARNYNDTFPDYPKLFVSKGWLLGYWVIGNYYKNKTDYHGAYPHSYLKRILSLFPDIRPKNTLHLFAGSLTREDVNDALRFDINPDTKPDIVGDAEKLSKYKKKLKNIKLILADPPYSEEDSLKYGVSLINRNKVVKECASILKRDGYLVWLDQVYPMFSKNVLRLVGTIGLMRSTNHRFRTVLIWKKEVE